MTRFKNFCHFLIQDTLLALSIYCLLFVQIVPVQANIGMMPMGAMPSYGYGGGMPMGGGMMGGGMMSGGMMGGGMMGGGMMGGGMMGGGMMGGGMMGGGMMGGGMMGGGMMGGGMMGGGMMGGGMMGGGMMGGGMMGGGVMGPFGASNFAFGSAAMGGMLPFMGQSSGGLGGFSGANMATTNSAAMIGIGSFMSIGNQVANMSFQMNQSLMLAEHQAKVKGAPPFNRADDFFPNCMTSPAEQKHYNNACQNGSVMDPISQAKTIEYLLTAQNMEQSYKEALMGGKDFNTRFGIQCIQREGQKLGDILHREQEKLNGLISKLNENAQQSKEQLQKMVNQIATLNSELDGSGEGGQNRESTSKNLDKIFNNNSCQYAMDTGAIKGNEGLYNIRDSVKANQGKAQSIFREIQSGNIEKMIDADIKELSRFIKTDVEPPSSPNFAIVTKIYLNERKELDFKYSEMKRKLETETKVTLPQTLSEFERSREKNDLPNESYFRDSFVKDCLNNNARTFPVTNIVTQIQQISNGKLVQGQSQTLESFRLKLKQIIDQSGVYIDTQIKMIKELQAEYQSQGLAFQVLVPSTAGGETNKYVDAAGVLTMNKDYCSRVYENEPVAPGSNQSHKDRVNEEIQNLKQFRNSMENIEQNLSEKVRNRIINCEGIANVISFTDCNATYERASENFCVKNSQICSKGTLDCLAIADQHIKEREDKIKAIAQNYNQVVSEVIKNQNQNLKQISKEVQESAAKLEKLIPGGRFKIGGLGGGNGSAESLNLFVAEPLEGNQNYKIGLKGDGNLDFFNNLGEKLLIIKTALQTQEENIKTKVNERINELKTQYGNEQKYWNELATKCTQANATYAQMLQQSNQMRMMQENQRRMMMNNLCTQLQFARVGPGCEQQAQMLSQQMMMIMPPGPEVKKIGEYAQVCNSLSLAEQSRMADQTAQNSFKGPLGSTLAEKCRQNGGNSDSLFNTQSDDLRSSATQFSFSLNAKYGKDITPEQISSLINGTGVEYQGGEVSSILGLNKTQLSETSAGQYLLSLFKLKKQLQYNGFKGNRLCEYMETLRKSGDPAIADCSKAGSGNPAYSANVEAVAMQMSGPDICINREIDTILRSSGDPNVQKIIGSLRDLEILQVKIVPELQINATKRLGESSNMNCVGQAMTPSSVMPTIPGVMPMGMQGVNSGIIRQ